MAWFLPAALTGLGLLRGQQQAQREQAIEDQTRKQRAAEIRYSPWTGMQSFTPIRPAGSQFGTILGSGIEGLGGGINLGQAISGSEAPGPRVPLGSSRPTGLGSGIDPRMMQQQTRPSWLYMNQPQEMMYS